MRKWLLVVIVSAYLLNDYLFCFNTFLVILGSLIGFFCALLLHYNKYVAILAHVLSSKLSSLTDASSIYDNDNMLLNITLNTMWFNVGYWKNVLSSTSHSSQNSFVRACEDMTSLLTSSAGLIDGETILDVGCGSGEQDIFIWERHKKSKIVAIELSSNQVSYARNKAASLGISEILFEEGNAVDLVGVLSREEVSKYLELKQPAFDSPAFDVVLALDCAYHFQFRFDFFLQAHKVLRKGGRIGLADICLADGVNIDHLNPFYRFGLKWILRRMSIPPENLTDMRTYKQKLENAGFGAVTVSPITEHVFPGLLRFTEEVESRLGCVVQTYRLNKLRSVSSFLRNIISRGVLEYVIVSGIK